MRAQIGTIATLLVLMIVPSASAFSAAHPHSHDYYGSSLNNAAVFFNEKVAGSHIKEKATVAATVTTGCLDFTPIAQITPLPPQVVRDQDPDVGVGMACFSFETMYGSDTGSTVTITTIDSLAQEPVVWLACVDVNGDGLCSTLTGDEVNLCATGTVPFESAGSVSLSYGGACTIYENPAAVLNPNVYVFYVGAVSTDDTNATVDTAIAGEVYLN